MKFTLSWLKDYIDINNGITVTEIADKLTMLGIEVEALTNPLEKLEGFRVAEITSCQKHPNADKLSFLEVTDGKSSYQIVCGATNCKTGLKGVLALPGDIIPVSGEPLKKGVVIRGIESQGMMCSEKELLLSDNHEGIIELSADAKVGESAATALKGDIVFEIKVTPNRGDCLGVYGIARELAAAGYGKLKPLAIPAFKGGVKSPIGVKVETENCKQLVGIYVKGVKNTQSPDWMKERLIAAGLRPISAIVDITNYINISFCRPLHAFDADRLNGSIIARQAADKEEITLLDGKHVPLDKDVMVIADEKEVLSIAGIMGGMDTGCSDGTENVFIESAYFVPMNIAATGRRLNVYSDSRYRFERGVDHRATADMARHAAQMIMDICGGQASDIVIAGNKYQEKKAISFNVSLVEKKCAVKADVKEAKDILEKLGCTVIENNGILEVIPPSWRFDLEIKENLIEEIVRVKGYELIPSLSIPKDRTFKIALAPKQIREMMVRRSLAMRGLNQSISWSFMKAEHAKLFGSHGLLLANPLNEDLAEMRPSIVPNLLNAYKRNYDLGFDNFGLFEVGPVFLGRDTFQQKTSATTLRGGSYTLKSWSESGRKVDAFDAKADALAITGVAGISVEGVQVIQEAPSYYHPGKSGTIKLGKTSIGYFGELHPSILKAFDINVPVAVAEVFLEDIPLPKAKHNKTQSALRLHDLQSVKRDFAFVVDTDCPADTIVNAIRKTDKEVISKVRIFDIYKGENIGKNKKSIAVQVTMQPKEKTFTDAQIEEISEKIINNVKKETKAELRT